MRAGKLRHRITIQAPTTLAQSITGREVPTWGDAFTCWASVDPLSGREYFQAQQRQMEITHEVTLRDPAAIISIRPKMRLKYGDREFNIEVIRHVERGKELRLLCRELVGASA